MERGARRFTSRARIRTAHLAEHIPKSSAAAELWGRTLLRIPTLFGRLAYLAGLRQPGGERYEHAALVHALGAEDADAILRRSHSRIFGQWLALSLEEKKSDLDEYLREIGALEVASRFRELTPPTAREVERQLYISDVETLLELLRREGVGHAPAPAAWPRR